MAKQYSVTVNGNVYDVTVEEIGAVASAPVVMATPVANTAPAAPVKTEAPVVKAAAPVASAEGTAVEAPLNGTVLKINVNNGDSVKSGDVLCVLEAMKMENDIVAPRDGKVTSVAIQKGASVNAGDVLFTLA